MNTPPGNGSMKRQLFQRENRLLYRAQLVDGQDVRLFTTATNGMLGNKNHGYVYYTLSGTELKDGEV